MIEESDPQSSERRIREGFRFFDLTDDQVGEFRALGIAVTVRPSRQEKGRFVLSFWFSEGVESEPLERFVERHHLKGDQYGYFISVVTESDSEIVTLSPQVAGLHRKIGGLLEFSFTVV